MRNALRWWDVLVGAIFLLAATSKAWDSELTVELLRYLGISDGWVYPATFGVVGLEATLGASLLWASDRRAARATAVALLVAFTGLLAYLLTRHDAPSCGCLGLLKVWQDERSERIASIARNAAMLLAFGLAAGVDAWRGSAIGGTRGVAVMA